jgi:hypothetical protein
MRRPLAYDGHRYGIAYAVCLDGTSPGEAFYDALGDADKAKLNKLFEYLGDHGAIRNEEKFKKVSGAFFEFKSHQIRMPCYFRPDGLVVITHGFIKKKDKMPPAELRRAERIRDEDNENERQERQHREDLWR